MSRRNIALAIGAAATLALSATAWTAESDDQTVNFDVQAINSIDVDNAAVSLTINAATASGPTDDTESSSYSITTNAGTDGKKITARLNIAMPTGVTLLADVAAPSASSTSLGDVALTAADQDVVTGIEAVNAANVTIGYTLQATIAAGVVSGSRTVTYTLTDQT